MGSTGPLFHAMHRNAILFMLSFIAAYIQAETPIATVPVGRSASEILWSMQKLDRLGRALYVAAHPDDENTALISYLSLGERYETAYLSLTRGDGGQNLIGAELRDALGVIRTQELMAARRLDGGRQFFTRAKDFGFSKTAEETLRIWDGDAVLADMVWVIRTFRPDVIITRFRPEDSATHGHHTASARLAIEAFAAAADPARFPEQLRHVAPWQAKRVLWNTSSWFFRNNNQTFNEADYLSLDVGRYDPVLGKSYNEIASASRSMHRSQGFGTALERGSRREFFKLLAGDAPTQSIFDGIDTSWKRVRGGAAVGETVAALLAAFDPAQPELSIPTLFALREQLATLDDPWAREKSLQIDSIVASCLGLSVVALADTPVVTPETGEMSVSLEALQRSAIPVALVSASLPGLSEDRSFGAKLASNEIGRFNLSVELPDALAFSQPFWLRKEGTLGAFAAPDQRDAGLAENRPDYVCDISLEVAGLPLRLRTPVVFRSVDPARGESLLPTRNAPSASVSVSPEVALFANGAARAIEVRVDALYGPVAGVLSLEAPAGWSVEPTSVTLEPLAKGESRSVRFRAQPQNGASNGALRATLRSDDGRSYSEKLTRIRYDHIPEQFIFEPSAATAINLEVKKRGERVAYIEGAGDAVARSIEEIGYAVDVLEPSSIASASALSGYDAVVLGIRAYNTIDGIDRLMPLLFNYAEAGGVVVVQYNTSQGLKTERLAPFPLSLSRDRVTDETSAVSLLAPEHPALSVPNRITAGDFEGWTQERGLYFPNRWDDAFTPLLAMADPGEEPLEGSLLVANCGEGYFVYSGLSWFRQLPAGVPGAYRLFANLLSLGHQE